MASFRWRIVVALSLVVSQTVVAQSLIPSNLPACAASCQNLQNAQTVCIPPNAPTTNQATYQSCFCQSSYLPALKTSSPDTVCPSCSAADSQTIAQWYQSVCGAANGSPPATTLVTATAAGAPPAATTTQSSGVTSGPDGTGISVPNGQTWFSSHWRWVVMIIVLAIGFLTIGIVAGILHRRHRRRRDAAELQAAGPRGDLGQWGPNGPRVHDFAQAGAPVAGVTEKGKERVAADAAVEQPPLRREESQRLKKKGGWLRNSQM